MRTTLTRRGGRLWPAVLVASALTLGVTGWQLVDGRSVGAQVAPATTLVAAPTPAPYATPTPTRPARSAPSRAWPTHPAIAPRAARVHPPVRLTIARLDLSMPIVATTVDGQGRMALPEHPTEIGWYAFGPAPGARHGTAVLGGHVDSARYGTGPLVGLASLRRGDDVVVTGHSGPRRYDVVAVQRISKRALDPAEVFDRDGEPLLRIITCGGVYESTRGGYQDNLVVTARPR